MDLLLENGAIDVESAPGLGTTFYLYLPAPLYAASPVSRPAAPPGPA